LRPTFRNSRERERERDRREEKRRNWQCEYVWLDQKEKEQRIGG
jgi:hypothetical protein